ncbi:MAG TPA: VOC family protein [Polyangiales bacterium]|nr:VOC family protein [Polyangiales bacterium]
MRSPWISGVRSVAIDVPDLERARAFYTEVWQLQLAADAAGVLYLRGSGTDHHLLALHQASGAAQIRQITLRARSSRALSQIVEAAVSAGGSLESASPGLVELRTARTTIAEATPDPAGGLRVVLRDPDGRRYEVVHGDEQRAVDQPPPSDIPLRIAHAVLNSHNVASAQMFLERAFGFVLADRTRIMAFMNCDRDHHSLALADADNNALNHIAFVMPSIDSVMRGGGRLRDAGHAIEWGPGRHGPGNNVFNYFIDPFGIVIEYTAEVSQIDDSYQPGSPANWGWPAGRSDQWGICPAPSAHLKAAQREILFARNL